MCTDTCNKCFSETTQSESIFFANLLKVRDALGGREDDANALRPRGLSVNNFLSGAHGPAAGLELFSCCVLFMQKTIPAG